VNTAEWLALIAIAVSMLGLMTAGFLALGRRLDLHETRLNELADLIARRKA